MKIEIELYHTSEKLPEDRQYIHWLMPKGGYWTSGYYYVQRGRFSPGYFQSLHSAYYIWDGHTWWTPELPILPTSEGEEQ